MSHNPIFRSLLCLLVTCGLALTIGCSEPNELPWTKGDLPEAEIEIMATDAWVFEDSSLWDVQKDMLTLVKPGALMESIRRPGSVALINGTQEISDFSLTARVMSSQNPEVFGRDVIIVFGYRSPEEFYYAHLSNDNTVMPHNGIFVVDHSDRRRIDHQGVESAPPARLVDSAWHQVRLDRNTDSGSIEVFMDDLRAPLLTATDSTFADGAVGFGSFDDTGAIRDIRLIRGVPSLINPVVEPVELGSLTLTLEHFATIPASDTSSASKARINYLTQANDGSGRLFVNDQRGKLHVIQDGLVEEYLDVRGYFTDFVDAPGLNTGFSFAAFHPDFATNGKLYTVHSEAGAALQGSKADYSNGPDDVMQSVVVEWTTPTPDAQTFTGSHRELLRLGFYSVMHGIQQIGFNPLVGTGTPDYGMLYLAIGDGEAPGTQTNSPQLLQSHTGKFFRIDPLGTNAPNGSYGIPTDNPFVEYPQALGEIWAVGVRNPHRFSWDAETGLMYIGHIGEGQVDAVFRGFAGANYGWNFREGGFRYEKLDPRAVYPVSSTSKSVGFTDPVIRLDHDDHSSIVGGFVYRGRALPALFGKYLFGDIVRGRISYANAAEMSEDGQYAPIKRATLLDANGTPQMFDHFSQNPNRADLRFGMDAEGEIYVLSKSNGSVWKIVSASN